ncbi:MAG: hypothetical protein KAY96_02700 [Bacteroidia bacterium]|nr:hypothetical protein [Bacteroidia bacterium]
MLTFLNVSHYRLTKVRTSRDKLFWDLDGRYFYYKHGPLARLEVGQDHVQGQDYLHSIHGWIKGVNMPGDFSGLNEPGRDGDVTAGANLDRWAARDAYAYHLGFYDGDYDPIGTVNMGSTAAAWTDMAADILTLPSQGAGLYNGNIALMITDLNFPAGMSSYSGASYNAMAYQYDQLNRIKQSRSYIRDFLGWDRLTGNTGYFDTDYGYDRNGNILYMHRCLPYWTGTDWEAWDMDIQEYHYNREPGSGHLLDNKLKVVRDGVSGTLVDMDIDDQAGGFGNPDVFNYRYDAIGNLVRDSSEHIDTILWDLQGKVRAVIRTSAGRTLGMPDLYFWYDGMGRRIHKQVLMPVEDADPDTTDTWYALDPQGNVMSVYEQTRASGWKHTRVKEFPIYGADRLGMVTANLLLRSELMSLGPVFDPSWTYRALVVGEVMYDSPKWKDPADPDQSERNEGEYVVLVNNTDRRLPLSYFSLVELLSGDTVVLDSADTLEPQQRLVVAFTDSVELFGRLAMLPEVMQGDTRFSLLRAQMDMALPDKGGIVAVLCQEPGGDTMEVDRLGYGEYFGLLAENEEVVDSLIDSLELRSSLTSVLRRGFSMDPIVVGGGPVYHGGGVVGQSDPAVEPLPLPVPGIGSYLLSRGWRRYELKNRLSDVLAVVSDLKLGMESGAPDWIVEYYVGDVLRMQDYYPFGMEMPQRGYVSEEYRYGYNGQEKDNEISGNGNSYTALFWKYDARLGRRWELDPVNNSSISGYATFADNPIFMADPTGAEPWHPEKDDNGSQKLVADRGDNAATLEAYLGTIGVDYYPEEFEEWSIQISNAEQNQQVAELHSDNGKFDNLVGQFLMSRLDENPAWGNKYGSGGNKCSPVSFARSSAAVEFVYGSESEKFKYWSGAKNKPYGEVGYYQFQNIFGPGVTYDSGNTGDQNLARLHGDNLGLSVAMRKMAAPGVQVWSGTGFHVSNSEVWDMRLTPGAIIGLGAHSAIFVGYSTDSRGILQVTYWDDHNTTYTYGRFENDRNRWVKPRLFHGGNWN